MFYLQLNVNVTGCFSKRAKFVTKISRHHSLGRFPLSFFLCLKKCNDSFRRDGRVKSTAKGRAKQNFTLIRRLQAERSTERTHKVRQEDFFPFFDVVVIFLSIQEFLFLISLLCPYAICNNNRKSGCGDGGGGNESCSSAQCQSSKGHVALAHSALRWKHRSSRVLELDKDICLIFAAVRCSWRDSSISHRRVRPPFCSQLKAESQWYFVLYCRLRTTHLISSDDSLHSAQGLAVCEREDDSFPFLSLTFLFFKWAPLKACSLAGDKRRSISCLSFFYCRVQLFFLFFF